MRLYDFCERYSVLPEDKGIFEQKAILLEILEAINLQKNKCEKMQMDKQKAEWEAQRKLNARTKRN